jgi:hypothetical protein
MQKDSFDRNATYETVTAALQASERAITDVFFLPPPTPLTYASLFGMGVGRRAIALSSGFRTMVEQRNSLCAMPMVRMQLDTAIRFYAAFFVVDHQQFSRDVLNGKQINQMKSKEGFKMHDKYLVERVAAINPWMTDVYKASSGYIHFSHRHIQEAIRMGEGENGQMVIGPTDFDREPKHFLEPMRCMYHLNKIIEFALQDWFTRMCDPDGVTISASELWGEIGQQDAD